MLSRKIRKKIANFWERGIAKSLADLINRARNTLVRKLRLGRLLVESERRDKPHGARIAAIMMAKNECDIIEHCVRINLRSVDRLFVMDHNSADPTKRILRLLVEEGLPLELVDAPAEDAAYHQGEILTRMINVVAKTDSFDYIMPLDADEFLVHHEARWPESALHLLRPDQYGLVPWVTYVPMIDSITGQNPLCGCFKPRNREPRPYYKVIIGNEMAKDCSLRMGSHSLVDTPEKNAVIINTMSLQHLPVRSSSQIISKALTGANALRLKKNRRAEEGQHWLDMAHRFEGKTALSLHDLQVEALTYACQGLGESVPGAKVYDQDNHMLVGCMSDRLRWPELAVVNLDNNLKGIAGHTF